MKKRSIIALPAMLVAGLVVNTGTANAAGYVAYCYATGSYGSVNYEWTGGNTSPVDIGLGVVDTAADGHHVAVRLVTKNSAGTKKYWTWRHWYAGKDGGQTWYTTAQDNSGIVEVGVQAGTFEGNTLLHSCTGW